MGVGGLGSWGILQEIAGNQPFIANTVDVNLRKRAHNFEIPRCEDSLMRKDFIIRSLLANSY